MSPRVLLIRPPQRFHYGVWPSGPRLSIPTGLLSIASYLAANDVDVSIYDAFVEGADFEADRFTKKRSFKRPTRRSRLAIKWMNSIEPEIGTKPSSGTPEGRETVHFGASWQEIEAAITRIEPDIVGITNLFRENTSEALRTASLVKEIIPRCLVVVGGPNANAVPTQLLKDCPAVDLIGFGDGEYLMLQLTRYYEGAIPLESVSGLMYRDPEDEYRKTGGTPNARNPDSYGALDYGLIHLERYFSYNRSGIMARNKFLYPGADRAVSMVTSRGCPYNCSFCSVHIHAGKQFRRHSVDYLVAQIEDLVTKRHVNHIHFEDDNLTLDMNRFVALLREVIRRDLRFTWDTPNGAFAKGLSDDILELMKRSGCIYLIIGVESGDQYVLDNIIRKQPLKLNEVLNTFRTATRVGLDLHAFYIVGFPRETLEQIDRTFQFAFQGLTRYGVVPHLSLARADHGTALYDEAIDSGTLVADFPIANPAGVKTDMFPRHLITTEEFTPALLEQRSAAFHRRCIGHLVRDRVLFLLLRPRDLLGVMSMLLRYVLVDRITFRQALTKLFWCKLLYRNAMKDRRSRSRVKARVWTRKLA